MDRSRLKSFDINAPGRVNPSANSRPVIVGHRPIMADPMMRPGPPPNMLPPQTDASPVVAPPPPAPTAHVPKVIQVTDAVKQDLAASHPLAAAAVAPPASAVAAPTPAETPVAPQPPAANSAPQPYLSEEIPGAHPQMPAPPPDDSPDAPPQPQQLPHVPEQDLSHIPHMPVSPSHRRGGLKHIVLWLLIFIFLGGLAAYLLIDSGLIASSINLPFHIFNQA